MGGVFLGGTKEVFHIDVFVLEAVGIGSFAVGGLVRPRCGGGGGVDHKVGVGVQGLDVCVICNHLGSGTEEVG